MNKFIIIFLIILNPLIGRCDHAPYWYVTFNEITIYDSREDTHSQESLYQLDLSNLQLNDSTLITISYRTDTGESGISHLIFKNSTNDILLNISASDKATFILTKKELDIIDCKGKLNVIYKPPWANFVEFNCEQKLIEIN